MNPEDLAKQLSCPSGEYGIDVGNSMYSSNLNMIKNCIAVLSIQDDFSILELGFGNGQHISELLSRANNLTYKGLETSELMIKQAVEKNPSLNINSFILSDGSSILPFDKASFDCFFSSNTLYFWQEIELQLNEIYSVLKPNGQLSLAFVEKEFGKTLPFTSFGFNLYSETEMGSLLQSAGFKDIQFQTYQEEIKSKNGQLVNRVYFVVKGVK